MNLLVKQLNRDFAKWKQCGNTIIGLQVADKTAQSLNIYALEITRYNDKHEPIATNKNPRIFKNKIATTWAEIEMIVFGQPTEPDFRKVVS